MKKLQAIKSFKSRPSFDRDGRKERYMRSFMNNMNEGSEFFFDLLLFLMGGVTPKMLVNDMTKKGKTASDLSLICAVVYFRPMSQKGRKNRNVVLPPFMPKLLAEYSGISPSPAALA